MKETQNGKNYYFVDESGDPVFYDRDGNLIVGNEGVSKILILGFIKTSNPEPIRHALSLLAKEISSDKYLCNVPSLGMSIDAFHAKDDCPEVREKVFRAILGMDFTAELFVARKIQNIFNKNHHRNESAFYDDLISRLFENKLHLEKHNEIFFAVKGSKLRQLPLENAINSAVKRFEQRWGRKIISEIKIYPQSPKGEPCLQVIDYVNWAAQRAYVKRDTRYYKFIEEKVKYLVDIYDTAKYPKNFYNSKNTFDIEKISPL